MIKNTLIHEVESFKLMFEKEARYVTRKIDKLQEDWNIIRKEHHLQKMKLNKTERDLTELRKKLITADVNMKNNPDQPKELFIHLTDCREKWLEKNQEFKKRQEEWIEKEEEFKQRKKEYIEIRNKIKNGFIELHNHTIRKIDKIFPQSYNQNV